MTIAIGAGHHPDKPGCIYKDLIEYYENMKVATHVQIELSKQHLKFYDFKGTLKQKVDYINYLDTDIAIEIHHNFNSNSEIRGTEIIYHPTSNQGHLLALKLAKAFNFYGDFQAEIHEGYYRYDKTKGFFTFTSKTKMPAVIIECLYFSNLKDRILLRSANYLNDLSRAVVGGIQNYAKTTASL